MVVAQPSERSLLTCLLARLQVGVRPACACLPCLPGCLLVAVWPACLLACLQSATCCSHHNKARPHSFSQVLDADVLVGHNIGAFDLTVLLTRMQHHKVGCAQATWDELQPGHTCGCKPWLHGACLVVSCLAPAHG